MDATDSTGAEALQRLLRDAGEGGQAKVDALVALSQRTVFVATWGGGSSGFRTLMNSNREAALPVFTSITELETAARRYGWLNPQGEAASREVGAREALHYALAQEVAYVVVDIAADHALEITPPEMEPLMSSAARRDSSGPFAVVGKVSDSVRKAVESSLPPVDSLADLADGGAPTTGQLGMLPEGLSLHAPPATPEDATLDAIADVLRQYPEVEWASVVGAVSEANPIVGLRLDTAYRARVGEIIDKVKEVAAGTGSPVATVLLDNTDVVRRARQEGVVFYPWRKR